MGRSKSARRGRIPPGVAVPDSLGPKLSNGPIRSFTRFFPQKKAFLNLGETGRNGTDLLLNYRSCASAADRTFGGTVG